MKTFSSFSLLYLFIKRVLANFTEGFSENLGESYNKPVSNSQTNKPGCSGRQRNPKTVESFLAVSGIWKQESFGLRNFPLPTKNKLLPFLRSFVFI